MYIVTFYFLIYNSLLTKRNIFIFNAFYFFLHRPIGSEKALGLTLTRDVGDSNSNQPKQQLQESVPYNGRNWFPLNQLGYDLLNNPDNNNNNDKNNIDKKNLKKKKIEKEKKITKKIQDVVSISMQYSFPLNDQFPSILYAITQAAISDGHKHRIFEFKLLQHRDTCLLGYNNNNNNNNKSESSKKKKENVICINLYWSLPIATYKTSLLNIENIMKKHGGKPHFGKYHTCTTQELHHLYPNMSSFHTMTNTSLQTIIQKTTTPTITTKMISTKTKKIFSATTHYLCYVTNGTYAPGAVCLAQSLALVKSRGRLLVIATNTEAKNALLHELQKSPNYKFIPMDIKLEITIMPKDYTNGASTHNGSGATLAVDAPRRCLFDDLRAGWILLDADLIAVQNPDYLLDLLDQNILKGQKCPTETKQNVLYAVTNFRIKKKKYGDSIHGNFNAGVMVVPQPSTVDGVALTQLVNTASVKQQETTEELLLNDLFRGRCKPLPHGYNTPKRIMHHAPLLWKKMVENKEIYFLHYMGAKPWMLDVKKRQGADWESENVTYKVLEKVWWRVRRCLIVLDKDGSIHNSLPLDVNDDKGGGVDCVSSGKGGVVDCVSSEGSVSWWVAASMILASGIVVGMICSRK